MAELIGLNGVFGFVDNIETVQAVLFIVGLILMFVEIFIPGFGIAGGAGVLLIFIGIVLTAETWGQAAIMLLILIWLIAFLVFILLRSARKGQIAKRVILNLSSNKQEGYTSNVDYSHLEGKEGMASTSLRTSGTGVFDGRKYDVVTEGSFIDSNTKIKVVSVSGRRIVVEPAPEEQKDKSED